MKTVLSFPPSDSFTPSQALASAAQFAEDDNLSDVLVVGYDSNGALLVRSSKLSRQDALWLVEQARLYVLNI